MYCPECKTELICGCDSCRESHPDEPNMMIVHDNALIGDDWTEECVECGLTLEVGEWLDIEADQYDEYKQGRSQ